MAVAAQSPKGLGTIIPQGFGAGVGRVKPYYEQGNWYRGGAVQMLFIDWLYGEQNQMRPMFPPNTSREELIRAARSFDLAQRFTTRQTRAVQSRASTRSMLLTGAMILLFVLYHLAHYTWGLAHPEFSGRVDAAGRADVYSMVVGSFGVPWIAGLYVAAMILLALHLSHGISSVFQTLGWRGPRSERLVTRLGPAVGALIAAGYCAMPVAVQAGLLPLPPGVTFR